MARLLFLGVVLSTMLLLTAFPAHAGQRQTHQTSTRRTQVTRASWYGQSFRGRRMASGAPYNPQKLTAAHRTLHIGSRVRVTELRTGRSVVVQITDRGPYARGRGIDLSYAAARQLGIVNRGVARVQVEVLETERPATREPVVTAYNWPKASWLPNAIVE